MDETAVEAVPEASKVIKAKGKVRNVRNKQA